MKKSRNITMVIVLIAGVILAAGFGVLIWYLAGGFNNKTDDYAEYSNCSLYDNPSSEGVNLSRGAGDPEKLINQFNNQNFAILKTQNISVNTNDLNFIQNCEKNMAYKASAVAIAKFNALKVQRFQNIQDVIDVLKNNNSYNIDLNGIVAEAEIGDKNEYTNNLINFYNIIFNLFGANELEKLFYQIEMVPAFTDQTVAFTKFGVYPNYILQCMAFGPLAAKKTVVNEQYNFGWWSANQNIEVVVHETGHAIDNYAYFSPNDRLNFNSQVNPQTGNCNSDWYFSGTSRSRGARANVFKTEPSDYLVQFLGKRAGISNSAPKQQLLAAWSFIQSGYGRTGTESIGGGNKELFAEGFAQWLLTPDDKKALNWEVLNEFYMEDFKKTYYLP